MILWLDHLIFGSGHGLGAPFWDSRYYWLSGQLYTYMGGLGAQLHSVQWRHPRAGERRTLCGRVYTPFHSHRRWGRVMVAWATSLPQDINAAHAELRKIQAELDSNWPPRHR